MIALTFDDGPDALATPAILDVLAAHGLPATFFVFGARAEAHPGLIARMLEAGHEVQPHCWEGHDSHHELGRDALEEEIGRTLRALESLGCPAPTIWRPPYGDIRDPESYDLAAAHGLRLVTWTLETCYWSAAHRPDRILGEIDSEARDDSALRPDSVVLMHDRPRTPRLLAGVLERIEARGYEVGLLPPDNPATPSGGDYRFGRTDGRRSCVDAP